MPTGPTDGFLLDFSPVSAGHHAEQSISLSTEVKAWNRLFPLNANSPGEQRRQEGLMAELAIRAPGPEPAIVPELGLVKR